MSSTYAFKMGVFFDETGLPFEQAAALAQELGARYAEFFVHPDQLTAQYAAHCRRVLDDAGLQAHAMGSAPNPFKQIHIDQIELAELPTNPEFTHDLDLVRRAMDFAQIAGAPNVLVSGFAWPGEFQNGRRVSPTWPQRYATGGGFIPPAELDKLAKAFTIIAELAERQDMHIAISVHPWEYANTSRNYRRIVERVNSLRLRAKWGPGDAYNCGELDTVTTGYQNLKPYLTSLHLKDLRTLDGPTCEFEYCAVGTGDVDYAGLFRTFARDHTDIVIGVATHFQPPGGTQVDAMRINYRNTLRLTEQAVQASLRGPLSTM